MGFLFCGYKRCIVDETLPVGVRREVRGAICQTGSPGRAALVAVRKPGFFVQAWFMSKNQNGSVDIVYLWVDGSDPVWRQKRKQAAAVLSATDRGEMALYGNVEGRFRDNDELRFSLRALEKFFPTHGHIYLVTDGQTPVWFKPSAGITVVDHRDLIEPDLLPTFDSGNIESYIHRIPNLSERFFYLNDDVFFGAPVQLADWFYPGGTFVAWSDDDEITDEPMRADATALENACRLSHQWLRAHASNGTSASAAGSAQAGAYQPVFRTFAHSPRPMLRSRMLLLEQRAPELFDLVRSTVFRAWDKPTIVSDFVLRWALANGQAKVCEHSHLYVSTGTGELHALDEALRGLSDAVGQLDFFCINDTTDNALPHDPRLAKVRNTLLNLFPQPSQFERTMTDTRRPAASSVNADQVMSAA